ncbi:helix-turn-helix transcriptional regulator [Paraburkholderia terricola]|uniref:DNA-binding CsgD family transcriptional regulator n=1 Tax=Paraburkholderia terricola TaxID=169427 RepID=A0ABU1M1B6_9BURK|nr:helix-turn-helix transcriptional regulator [Paraburkholderia terricola]MDR6412809.1 DNA-binding CsgD family transcriptional regulator [Paraburkholderia terricola]MDR6484919.1 DNA-binding CsgD family transcriptional regulator [Paraburkholderia terricola]
MDYVVTVDYPLEHLAAISNAAGGIDTPLMRQWLATRKPVLFDERTPWSGMDHHWLDNFGRNGLVNAAVDAFLDDRHCVGTYFSFHRLPAMDQKVLSTTFAWLTPLIHLTLMQVIAAVEEKGGDPAGRFSTLTVREREIATWVGKGKSNAEVAMLTKLSENTVKHHLTRILDKTGCPNRAGLAAAIAERTAAPLQAGTKVL